MGKAKTFGQLRRFPVRQRRFQSKSGPSPKVPRASIERRERKEIKAKDVGEIETVVRVRVMGREQQHNKQSGLLSVKIQREGRTKNARRGDRVSSAASNRSDEAELGRQCSQDKVTHKDHVVDRIHGTLPFGSNRDRDQL